MATCTPLKWATDAFRSSGPGRVRDRNCWLVSRRPRDPELKRSVIPALKDVVREYTRRVSDKSAPPKMAFPNPDHGPVVGRFASNEWRGRFPQRRIMIGYRDNLTVLRRGKAVRIRAAPQL